MPPRKNAYFGRFELHNVLKREDQKNVRASSRHKPEDGRGNEED